MRHTTFRFALDPTPVQKQALSRHAGASRFAYNQSLRLVIDALAANRVDPSVPVPWSGFDLINAFNVWKRTEEAGRVFVVARDGTITRHVTGLAWLAVEDLAVAHLARNKRLARAIGDAAWAEFGRQLRYKATWLGAELVTCDRWFASTKTCSQCQMLSEPIGLAERTFRCGRCGLATDRDRNAAANLAAWAERHSARPPDRQAGGRVINVHGGEGAGRHLGDGAAIPDEMGTEAQVT
jgi:transposase